RHRRIGRRKRHRGKLDPARRQVPAAHRLRVRARQARLTPPHVQQIGVDVVLAGDLRSARAGHQALRHDLGLLNRGPPPPSLRTRQNRPRPYACPSIGKLTGKLRTPNSVSEDGAYWTDTLRMSRRAAPDRATAVPHFLSNRPRL